LQGRLPGIPDDSSMMLLGKKCAALDPGAEPRCILTERHSTDKRRDQWHRSKPLHRRRRGGGRSAGLPPDRVAHYPANGVQTTRIWNHATLASIDLNSNVSSSKFWARVPGFERSEPPELRISGGSLSLNPGRPGSDGAKLELLNVDAPAGVFDANRGLLLPSTGNEHPCCRAASVRPESCREPPARRL